MKLRLLKEHNGKDAGKVGVFLSEYAEELIANGIAEQLPDDYVVEVMPEKKQAEKQPIYIPVPVPNSYFEQGNGEEQIITKPKNK